MSRALVAVALVAVALVAVALVAVALVAPAAAEAPTVDPPATVAVIPLQSDRRLALYGQPVASELANALRGASFDVALVTEVSDVPARAWLVVDGRLVRMGTAVAIELRIRDPERAVDVARLAAKATSLAEIDQATRRLGVELVATLERERATRAAASAAADASAAAQPVLALSTNLPDSFSRHATAVLVDPRPIARIAVSGRSVRDRSGADLDVSALGTPAATALAAGLGYRTATGPGTATLSITIELLTLAASFERDVPVARARARVKVERAGALVFDRVVRTDTVVGSRGDRLDTLVRLVAAQVTDVVAPRIRERLGTP